MSGLPQNARLPKPITPMTDNEFERFPMGVAARFVVLFWLVVFSFILWWWLG